MPHEGSSTTALIEVTALSKRFEVPVRAPGIAAAVRSLWKRETRVVRAVEGVTFSVAAGEVVGFLGPNGAGKTTTLKVLAGLLHPTDGLVRVAGFDPGRRETEFLRSIALVAGQKQQLLWDLPPTETFALNQAIYDVPEARFRETMDELIELLRLGDLLDRPVRQLSLGERMKCELAAALVHRPKVLFLDEPTIGLDVVMQGAVRGFLRDYNRRHGATMLLTSHTMDDVRALCERVVVVDHGKVSFDGALDDLVRRAHPGRRISLRFRDPVGPEALAALGARVLSREAGSAALECSRERLSEVLSAALASLPVSDLTVEDPPLEDVLAELFTDAERAS